MSENLATLQDVLTLWRSDLTADEQARVSALLPFVSSLIRQAAVNAGQDLDEMIAQSDTLEDVARMVTVDVVGRIMRQSTTGEPMSQESQSALGYNYQGTYAIPGGGMANALMQNDLKRLGIFKSRIGATNPYAEIARNNNPACRKNGCWN